MNLTAISPHHLTGPTLPHEVMFHSKVNAPPSACTPHEERRPFLTKFTCGVGTHLQQIGDIWINLWIFTLLMLCLLRIHFPPRGHMCTDMPDRLHKVVGPALLQNPGMEPNVPPGPCGFELDPFPEASPPSQRRTASPPAPRHGKVRQTYLSYPAVMGPSTPAAATPSTRANNCSF